MPPRVDASTPCPSATHPAPRPSDDDAPADAVCRVCLCDVEELPESRLVKLECACVGVYVHETCAEKGLRTKGSNVCEVCRESTQFDVPESFVGRLLRRAGVASERDRGDDAREYGPAVGDVIWIFLTMFCSVWVCLRLLLGIPIGPALAMSYCFGLGILMGVGFFIIPLRRASVPRSDSRAFLWLYALSMFITHQIAFGLALRPIPTQERRIKHAFSLTFAISIAAFSYPQIVMLGGCLWRALARGDAAH